MNIKFWKSFFKLFKPVNIGISMNLKLFFISIFINKNNKFIRLGLSLFAFNFRLI